MQSFILAAEIHSKSRLCPDIARLSYHNTLEKYLRLTRDDEARGPSKKDCKSLTQRLFDTAAMKLFQSAHVQAIGQSYLSKTDENDHAKETRNVSETGSDYKNTSVTESTLSRRQNRSKEKPVDASDHEWPSHQNASLPIDSSGFPKVPNDVNKREWAEATQSETRSSATESSEKLLNSGESCRYIRRHADDEQCLACQRNPQQYGHARTLQYMNCELIDDIRHLLSLEQSQGNLENHFKVCV